MAKVSCENCGRDTRDMAAKNFSETPCGKMLCDWCFPVHVEACITCNDEIEIEDADEVDV